VIERVFILGAGRAGRGLARALRASGAEVIGLHGTRAESGEEPVTAGSIPSAAARADAIMVTVRDAQLEGALGQLASAGLAPGAIILHASGSAEPAGLTALRVAGYAAGTFHPLVPLADPARASELLRGAWIGVDGDERAIAMARALAVRVGARVLLIPEGEKARYHAAAVFAANFPTVLAALAARLLNEAGVSHSEGWPAVLGLMRAALSNLGDQAPSHALTGPIARGDVDTVARHLTTLAADPPALETYRILSRAAVDLAREQGTDGGRLAEIERRLRMN
jgi:predicted short-subunit dehydrogenase-like oxidoreductase (DUF2520 family)